MKSNSLTLLISAVVVLVFASLLFCFQVRQTEIALVTTFGKPTRSINVDPEKPEPGLYFKWPWPIQKVQSFDKRVQNFEGKFEETLTQDRYPLLVSVYAGWTISDPALFRERFGGSVARAEAEFDGLIRNAKNSVVGKHTFANFISTDESQLQFTEIEKEIRAAALPAAKQNYGMDINFLGIKRIGLPESITQKVFDRMKAERQRYVQKLQADGDAQAANITSEANLQRDKLLATARADANKIQGEAEKEAAESLKVLEQKPDLAIFLIKIKALEDSMKERTTLVLDQRTPPFDLLDAGGKNNAKPLVAPGGK